MSTDQLVRITSWNVAGKDPLNTTMLDGLFDDSQRMKVVHRPDIQIVGLQEAPSYLFAEPWTNNLSSTLNKRGYILFKRHKLSGILLYIFVLREIILRTRDFETESVKTGFGGLLGNKGGVSLRFTLNGNPICVVNSHLAPHQEQLKQRIDDYHSILNGTKFLVDSRTPGIMKHDYSFWFGDLNFRFDDIEKHQVLSIITSARTSGSPENENKLISELHKYDQLIRTRQKGEAFVGFEENLPSFMPTYKFQIGSKDMYDSEHRIPAWTDRILFRYNRDSESFQNNLELKPKLEQLFYQAMPNFDLSDHKPITSLFRISTFDPNKINPSDTPYEVIKFLPVVGWNASQDGRLWYKISNELFYRRPKVLSSWDKIALYKSDFASLEEYQTIVYANNIARVAPRLDAQEVPYQSSATSTPRSSSPSNSRRGSTTIIDLTIHQGVEAITLNSSNTSPVTVPLESPALPPDAIIGDGFKYFTVLFSDEALIPGKYVLLYLKTSSANEFNVYGVSETFTVAS